MPILNTCPLIGFVGAIDLNRAKEFYANRLGLPIVSDEPYVVVFNANGTMLRVTLVRDVGAVPYTVLGWSVTDIAAAVLQLQQDAVTMERFPGFEQDELGIWTAPGGAAKVAWFKDPDGNVLSVSQH